MLRISPHFHRHSYYPAGNLNSYRQSLPSQHPRRHPQRQHRLQRRRPQLLRPCRPQRRAPRQPLPPLPRRIPHLHRQSRWRRPRLPICGSTLNKECRPRGARVGMSMRPRPSTSTSSTSTCSSTARSSATLTPSTPISARSRWAASHMSLGATPRRSTRR